MSGNEEGNILKEMALDTGFEMEKMWDGCGDDGDILGQEGGMMQDAACQDSSLLVL